MKAVWKFELNVTDEDVIFMPIGAKVLKVEETRVPSILNLWAEVETTAARGSRKFYVIGTGDEIEPGLVWVDTIKAGYGGVWHVYERESGL